MRHGWVRDIADFAKYALLKRLAASDLRLGVFWYLTTHGAPSKPLVTYLSRSDLYAPLDPQLFEALRSLHNGGRADLTLEDVERGGILPVSAVFYSAPLATSGLDRTLRAQARLRWFEDGLALTRSCDLVFLDPDTGLLPPRRRPGNKGGEEYTTLEEVLTVCRRGQSVVIVQFGSPQNFEREPIIARERLAMLRGALAAEGLPTPWGIWWRDGHKVGLLVAPCELHRAALRARTDEIFADPAWSSKVIAL